MSIRVIVILVLASLVPAMAADTLVEALELYRRGNCKDAKPLLEKVLARQPKNATIRRLIASCETPQPKTTVARASRKVAPPPEKNEDSETPKVSVPPVAAPPTERELAGNGFLEAEIHIKARRLQEAERLLTRVVEEKPLLALPRVRLAEIYSGTRRFQEAAHQYQQLARLPDASPEFTLRAAQNLTWAKELAGAVPLYESYLNAKPNDAEARLALANVLFWQDRLPEAAKAYGRYLELKPDDADANLNRGRALLWTENYADALPSFLKARQLNKTSRDAMVDLAIAECYEHLDKPSEALTAFERALAKSPGIKEAAEGRDRLSKQIMLRDAYDRQEKGDYAAAAKAFLVYHERNPEDESVVLQLARLHSWNKDQDKALGYYSTYLGKQPKDIDALREVARIQITQPDFAAARKSFATIVESGKATADDYAGLINAHVWDGHYDAAQPFIDKLIALDPNHEVARNARSVIVGRARTQELERARLLASTGKFSDALQTYRKFVQKFGADREIELAVARLFAWDGQTGKSIQAYQEYLSRYGQDNDARLELADLARWNGKPRLAETEYRRIVKSDTTNTAARFGLAQISDQRGDDRFSVYNSYRDVLGLDPSHRASRDRLGDIATRVSPSLHYRQNAFHDSDSFSRSLNTIEAAFPMQGGLRITPLARFGTFNQFRQVGGGDCNAAPTALTSAAVSALSQEICDTRGNMHGLGGGVRLDFSPKEGYLFTAEAVDLQFNGPRPRWSPMLSAELVMTPRPRTRFILGFRHRDGIFDLNTISSLYAGISSTTVEGSFEVPLNDRWSFWLSGGAARYSRGRIAGFDDNTQKRITARVNYQIMPWITAGYYVRASNFQRFSPLYFSPDFYGTTGVSWTWDKQISKTVSFVGDLEIGYGRINRYDTGGVYNTEFSLYPAFLWRVRPDLALQMGYRFGRGRSSAFGSPVYSTGSLDFGLSNFFVPAMPRPNPNRIEIR